MKLVHSISDDTNVVTSIEDEKMHLSMEEPIQKDKVNIAAVPASTSQKTTAKPNYEYLCHNCNVCFSSRGDFESHYRYKLSKNCLNYF